MTMIALNRLTVAHLLLWMAGTGLALLYFQRQRPPPPESIGFASFITAPGSDVEVEMAKARQHLWRKWQNQFLVGLAASPIYGAAISGIGIAVWRTSTGRFGFPTQPGHWLLLEIGVMTVLVALRDQLQLLPLSDDGRDFVLGLLMFAVATAAAVLVGRSLWRLPMITVAGGILVVCIAYMISFRAASLEPPPLYGVGLFLIGAVPFLALVSAIVDVADRSRHDAFHWVGVAVCFGVVVHLLVRVGVGQF
jgi:hypothetical protein